MGGTIRKKIFSPLNIILVLLPLAALFFLGTASYLWFKAVNKNKVQALSSVAVVQISPDKFSLALEKNIYEITAELGISEKNIKLPKKSQSESVSGKTYNISVPLKASFYLINLKIDNLVGSLGGKVIQGIEDSDGITLTLKVGVKNTVTDTLILKKVYGIEAKTAEIALLMDDFGVDNFYLAGRICNLKQAITLSVLPFQKYTADVVELAVKSNKPYILHMPMEPLSIGEDAGSGAIYISDSEEVIRKKLDKAFGSVRGAKGLNNHMGSKATGDLRTMEILMKYLNEKNYFFVDSQTSRNSIAYSLAGKYEVKSALMYTYLDATDDKDYISKRFEEIFAAAFKRSPLIVICHARPNTTEILERKLAGLEKRGIRFVKIEDVLH